VRGASWRRDDALRQLVRRQVAVAEGETRLGRDDEGRVAHDQVERLVLDRLEEAAVAHLEVVEAVQRGVELREGERPRVHVRRDHTVAVPRGE
jgi:hypothetical protein